MPRFLHLADVHLGFDRYDSPERTKDFFLALQDVIEQYALQAEVDFVLIAGDLFEQRQILPATLNQAQVCLDMLKEAEIPVLAIEGNHDYRPYGTRTSWLRYLADWERLILLEPSEAESLEPWTPSTRVGGYIDLDCGVRVIGSRWYGAAAVQGIAKLALGIEKLPAGPDYTVMMFHHGLEGQMARYNGALRYQDLMPLKTAGVDYLALGHIHKNYAAEGWIFNPGSLEANSIAEAQEQNPRGVYLVEFSPTGIQAQLKRDYRQRPIVRLQVQADSHHSAADLEQAAISTVQAAAHKTQQAIVELRIDGQVSFNRLEINVRELRARLQQMSQALIFLLKYEVSDQEYATYVNPEGDAPTARLEIERTVFTDLLSAQQAYREQAPHLTQGLIDLKNRVLQQQSEAELYQFLQEILAAPTTAIAAPE